MTKVRFPVRFKVSTSFFPHPVFAASKPTVAWKIRTTSALDQQAQDQVTFLEDFANELLEIEW